MSHLFIYNDLEKLSNDVIHCFIRLIIYSLFTIFITTVVYHGNEKKDCLDTLDMYLDLLIFIYTDNNTINGKIIGV